MKTNNGDGTNSFHCDFMVWKGGPELERCDAPESFKASEGTGCRTHVTALILLLLYIASAL